MTVWLQLISCVTLLKIKWKNSRNSKPTEPLENARRENPLCVSQTFAQHPQGSLPGVYFQFSPCYRFAFTSVMGLWETYIKNEISYTSCDKTLCIQHDDANKIKRLTLTDQTN